MAACLFCSRNEQKVLLVMRIVEVNAPEHLRLCDHDASSIGFKQPVLLGLPRQPFDNEFDHASVAAVRDTITSMNLFACLVPQRHWSLSNSKPNRHREAMTRLPDSGRPADSRPKGDRARFYTLDRNR